MKKQILLLLLLLAGCTGIPDKVAPVSQFNIDNYLGTWYEIARLDHSFERGLSHVCASYAKRDDGGVDVINRGFSKERNAWDEARGKAYFVHAADTGYLKVSFFGPFYGSYIIFDLDNAYQHALVSGPDKSYLWILARQPRIDDHVKKRLITRAQRVGFDVSRLLWIEQGKGGCKS